jgi:hypothetical protein
VILGSANAGNHSLLVGRYRSLATCEAAANEAKGIGLEKEPLVSFACAPLVHPTLRPENRCGLARLTA